MYIFMFGLSHLTSHLTQNIYVDIYFVKAQKSSRKFNNVLLFFYCSY